jgi:hypothetical protein
MKFKARVVATPPPGGSPLSHVAAQAIDRELISNLSRSRESAQRKAPAGVARAPTSKL